MNKSLIILTAIFLLAETAFAQQRIAEKTFSVKSGEKVDLNLRFGELITVKGWDKDEVSFRALIEINNGKLNDALLLDYMADDNRLRISADYDEERIKDGRREDCPDRRYSSYNWNGDGDHYVVCSNIVYEIYVPHDADLNIDTISGDIELSELKGPIVAKSISGFVDLSWPGRQGAGLSMKTISGEAYSDLGNLTFRNRQKGPPMVGYELRGTIGSGGPDLRLESISGDIYLRKEKGSL